MSFSVGPTSAHFPSYPTEISEIGEVVAIASADTPEEPSIPSVPPAPASTPHSPLSPRDSAAVTDEAHPATAPAAPEVAIGEAPAEDSNSSRWDMLKSAGKIALIAIGVIAAIAAFVSTIGLFTGLVSLFTALPLIAQLSIAIGTLAATIAAFILHAEYFPGADTNGPSPQEQAAAALDNRLRALIQEVVPGAVRGALQTADAN